MEMFESNMAEFIAIHRSLHLVTNFPPIPITKLVIESDYAIALSWINGSSTALWRLNKYSNEIRNWCTTIPSIEFVHTFREGNYMADIHATRRQHARKFSGLSPMLCISNWSYRLANKDANASQAYLSFPSQNKFVKHYSYHLCSLSIYSSFKSSIFIYRSISTSADRWSKDAETKLTPATLNLESIFKCAPLPWWPWWPETLHILCAIVAMVGEELISLGKIAGPMVLTSLLLYSKSIISMLFLGHLGEMELAGGSLSIGFANITGYSVLKGLAMGMEPICCQAFGAKKWALLNQTYNKALCLLLLAVFPISILWLNMEPILLWLGQDQTITSVAKVYIKYSIPELLAQAHFHPLMIFLRSQGLTKPTTISAALAMILHIPITYFLVIYLNLGVKGVALASACNSINTTLGMLIYILRSQTTLKPWDAITIGTLFHAWQPLLALAVPSLFSVCLEWWWYEIMILLSGLLSNPQASVAAMGILIQTTGFLYVFPYSLSLGLSTRVGHELGAEQPAKARQVTIIGLLVAVVCGLTAFSFTIAIRNVWGKLYTYEPQTLALISIALPILGFCELGNCPQTAACGILTGSARPKVGACINFGSFYLIGLPVALLTSFKFKMGFVGMWFGLAAAQVSCLCMMAYILVFTDWMQQAKRAKELTQATEIQNNDLETTLLS